MDWESHAEETALDCWEYDSKEQERERERGRRDQIKKYERGMMLEISSDCFCAVLELYLARKRVVRCVCVCLVLHIQ